jgi:hypothetical protein
MSGKAHPNVFLKFGFGAKFAGEPHIGMSEIELASRPDGSVAFACWFHGLAELAVLVMYAVHEERRNGLVGAWHPRISNALKLADFREGPPTGLI